jgi:hypothetical protein
MKTRLTRLSVCALGVAAFGACATAPIGPSVLVLPGSHASFEQFQHDDDECRGFAANRSGAGDQRAQAAGVAEAAATTAVGAAAGAAIGAAAGDAGEGAAIGAGSGLLIGAANGTARAERYAGDLQRRYDHAYVQCMYAKGHQVPVPQGVARNQGPPRARRFPPPPPRSPRSAPPPRDDWTPPPPPAGEPPPPPPDAS